MIMLCSDLYFGASAVAMSENPPRQFFSLWYLENTMMKNQQLYAEKSA